METLKDQKDKNTKKLDIFLISKHYNDKRKGGTQNGKGARGKHLILLEGSSGTLLGEALVADELGADSLERRVTLGLDLLDTVTVSLLVYLVAREREKALVRICCSAKVNER